MKFDSLAGATSNSEGKAYRELLFAYRREDGSLEYLSIPLRADNRPIPPFAFAGTALTFYPNLGGSVSSTQANGIIRAAPQLTRRDLSPSQRAAITGSQPEMYDSYGSDAGPLLAIAYQPLPDGRYQRTNFSHKPDGSSQQLPSGSIIVLVPNTRDRPAEEIIGARVVAVLLTPPAVVVDAVAIAVAAPCFFVYFEFTGHLI